MHATARLLAGLLLIFGASAPAWADIAPPQSCTAPGQPCSNAGPSSNQAGTCTTTTCSRVVPAPDGGTMVMTYACTLCQISGAGGAGQDASAGSGGSAGSAGSGGSGGSGNAADASTTPTHKGSGCSFGGGTGHSPLAGLLALAGLGLVAGRRRCRRAP